MFISQQYRSGQIQQSVTLWYICANLIENESLVTSTDKNIQSDSGHICKNPLVPIKYAIPKINMLCNLMLFENEVKAAVR